eukprot:jgi/Bigna1/128880/aug1.7_g3588
MENMIGLVRIGVAPIAKTRPLGSESNSRPEKRQRTIGMAANEEKTDEVSPYILSATLPHGSGAREIAVESNNRLLVAEANTGSVRVWEKNHQGWELKPMSSGKEKLHQGLCMVVSALADAKGYPTNTYFSGGGDKRAVLFQADGKRIAELSGHTNAVHSVSVTHDGNLLTGCWDGIAREWNSEGKCVFKYPPHKNSAVVLGLPSGEVVTAGGEGDVCVYKNRTLVKKQASAHAHVVSK